MFATEFAQKVRRGARRPWCVSRLSLVRSCVRGSNIRIFLRPGRAVLSHMSQSPYIRWTRYPQPYVNRTGIVFCI